MDNNEHNNRFINVTNENDNSNNNNYTNLNNSVDYSMSDDNSKNSDKNQQTYYYSSGNNNGDGFWIKLLSFIRKYKIQLLFVLVLLFVGTTTYLFLKEENFFISKNKTYLKNLEIDGYNIEFSEDNFEYVVVSDENRVYVRCDINSNVDGCNEKIIINKDVYYDHEINATDKSGNKVTYIIHFRTPQYDKYVQELAVAEKKEEEIDDTLNSATTALNNTNWTNESVSISVNKPTDIKLADKPYSFDNGKTWQESNKSTVSSNAIINVQIKDSEGNISNTQPIVVDKIDKEAPEISLSIKEATKNKIIITLNGTDNLSGIKEVSWNDGEYTNNRTLEVAKVGTYTAVAKDEAGNISKKATITIKSKDFPKDEKITKKTFTATFNINGATTVGSKVLSCTTEKDSCTIKTPNITVKNGSVIGWNTSANANTANVGTNQAITLTDNISYYAITKKTFTGTFNRNGASSIGSGSLSCSAYNTSSSCSIKAPSITSSDRTIYGWNTDANSIQGQYKVNSNILLTNNQTYYAITKKNVMVAFRANGATSLLDNNGKIKTYDSCSYYNTSNSCSVTLPNISRTPGDVIGWNTNSDAKTATLKSGESFSANSNTNVFAITTGIKTAIFVNIDGKLQEDFVSCTVYNSESSCNVKSPSITRSDGSTPIGWNTDGNAKTVIAKAGGIVSVSKDAQPFYPIIKRTITVKFEKNGASILEYASQSCDVYNDSKECNIKMPRINKTGYISTGFANSKTSKASYDMNKEYSFSTNTTLYAVFSKTDYVYRAVSVYKTINYGEVTVEIDNACSSADKTKFANFVKETNSKLPSLFKYPGKVFILSESAYNSVWGKASAGMSYSVGGLYGMDVRCSYGIAVLIHEMSHKWNWDYNNKYGTGGVSQQKDIIEYYNKYKKMTKNRPLNTYAYTNEQEFIAESVAIYYMKFIAKDKTYDSYIYPNDYKKTIENYLKESM